MSAKSIDCPTRTKEEIISWLSDVRRRKEAWEKKVDEKFTKRLRSKKEAAESAMFNSMKP